MFGCLRRFIVLFVIIIGVGYYVLDTYGAEIYSDVKIAAIDFALNDIDLSEFTSEENSRKIKILIDEYFDEIKDLDLSVAYDKSRVFFGEIKKFLEDSNISEIEFEKLNELIKNER